MCNYLIDQVKWRSKTTSPDASIAVNVRFPRSDGSVHGYEFGKTLEVRTKVDGQDLCWAEDPSGTYWSIVAYHGSFFPNTGHEVFP